MLEEGIALIVTPPVDEVNLMVEGARTQQDGQAGSNDVTARLGLQW